VFARRDSANCHGDTLGRHRNEFLFGRDDLVTLGKTRLPSRGLGEQTSVATKHLLEVLAVTDWLSCCLSAAILRSKTLEMSTTMLGCALVSQTRGPREARSLAQQLRKRVRVSRVGITARSVASPPPGVGVTGVDALPVAFGVLGDDEIGLVVRITRAISRRKQTRFNLTIGNAKSETRDADFLCCGGLLASRISERSSLVCVSRPSRVTRGDEAVRHVHTCLVSAATVPADPKSMCRVGDDHEARLIDPSCL